MAKPEDEDCHYFPWGSPKEAAPAPEPQIEAAPEPTGCCLFPVWSPGILERWTLEPPITAPGALEPWNELEAVRSAAAAAVGELAEDVMAYLFGL
eukprot:symbB.v1.2.007223.t1/scaffold441.1/size205278/10